MYICVKLVSGVHIIATYNKSTNKFLTKEIEKLVNVGNKVLLYRDLNARHSLWSCNTTNKRGNVIFNYVQIVFFDTSSQTSVLQIVSVKMWRELNTAKSSLEFEQCTYAREATCIEI